MSWVSPVGLHPGNDLAAQPDGVQAATSELDEDEGHDEALHAQAPAHGLMSELVLTAMVVLGVTLTTLAVLYTAGVFRPPVHSPLPGSAAAAPAPAR